MATTREIFARIDRKINERLTEYSKLGAVYKFILNGPDGGTWIVDLREDTYGVREAGEEEKEEANCTFNASDTHFIDMVDGKLRPENAFLTGKVKFTGDIALAMKLGDLLKK